MAYNVYTCFSRRCQLSVTIGYWKQVALEAALGFCPMFEYSRKVYVWPVELTIGIPYTAGWNA